MAIYDPYANIVALYDLEHRDFTDDIYMLHELARIADIEDQPILELGSGTGRVMVPLLEAGYRVIGVDQSEEMLDAAENLIIKGNWDDRAELVKGDMADIDAIRCGPFAMIIASLNSIMHLTSPRDQRAMIASAYRNLAEGGRLVIDTLNPSIGQLNHLLNTTHLEGSWQVAADSIEKWGHRQASTEPQTIETRIWYDIIGLSGASRRLHTRFDLRYLHQSELALMLEIAGFRAVDWYGSYELDPWDADSDRLIAIAHKDAE